jgi:uncharacterized protein YhdP
MRVQQQQQILRVRIQEAELASLLAGESVVNATRWPDGERQRQRVALGEKLTWQREPDGWCLSIPAAEVKALAARLPSKDGLAWSLADGEGPALDIRFDIDVRDSTRRRYGTHKGDR